MVETDGRNLLGVARCDNWHKNLHTDIFVDNDGRLVDAQIHVPDNVCSLAHDDTVVHGDRQPSVQRPC